MMNTTSPAAFDRDTMGFDCMEIVVTATDRQINPAGAICTFFPDDPDQYIVSVPYSNVPVKDPTIMDRIRQSDDPKPVSKAMKTQARNTPPMQVKEGSFQDYVDQNPGNKLVEDEMGFTEDIGYVTVNSHFMAIPFPSGDNAQGVFFLFLHSPDELKMAQKFQDKIVEKIKQRFDQ